MPPLTVTSSAFQPGQPIPAEFTCTGGDHIPPLTIRGAPAQARYLAVVFDDPDAPGGTWTHWTFWDLPVAKGDLARDAKVGALGAREGATSAGSVGYHGPCPPSGTHRYMVHAYATVDPLGLAAGASVPDVRSALKMRAIAQGTLQGTVAHK